MKNYKPKGVITETKKGVVTYTSYKKPSNIKYREEVIPVGSLIGTLFVVAFCILLLGGVIRATQNGTNATFADLLSFLQNVTQINMPFDKVMNAFQIVESWGVFDFLRIFINTLGSAIGFVSYLILGIAQLGVFVVEFIRFLYV